MSDEEEDVKVILTPEQAISALPPGDSVHNFISTEFALIGCDYDRENALDTLNNAKQIEIGGPACRRMKHGLAVWSAEDKVSFFEADEERLTELEQELTGAPAA